MMQNADGTVFSRAALEFSTITEGIERMRAVLDEASAWTEAQLGTAGNAAAGIGEEIIGRIVDRMRNEISGSAGVLLSSVHALTDQMFSGLTERLGGTSQETISAAMMETAAELLRVGGHGRSGTGGVFSASTAASTDGGRAGGVSGNTFIFQKPVETPYRHAQAIRQTMEEILYGR